MHENQLVFEKLKIGELKNWKLTNMFENWRYDILKTGNLKIGNWKFGKLEIGNSET